MGSICEFPVRMDGMEGKAKIYQLADKRCPSCFKELHEADIELPAMKVRVRVCLNCGYEEEVEKKWRY